MNPEELAVSTSFDNSSFEENGTENVVAGFLLPTQSVRRTKKNAPEVASPFTLFSFFLTILICLVIGYMSSSLIVGKPKPPIDLIRDITVSLPVCPEDEKEAFGKALVSESLCRFYSKALNVEEVVGDVHAPLTEELNSVISLGVSAAADKIADFLAANAGVDDEDVRGKFRALAVEENQLQIAEQTFPYILSWRAALMDLVSKRVALLSRIKAQFTQDTGGFLDPILEFYNNIDLENPQALPTGEDSHTTKLEQAKASAGTLGLNISDFGSVDAMIENESLYEIISRYSKFVKATHDAVKRASKS